MKACVHTKTSNKKEWTIETCNNLDQSIVMQTGRSQTIKSIYYLMPPILNTRKYKLIWRDGNRQVVV